MSELDALSRRDCPVDDRGCRLFCGIHEECQLLEDEGPNDWCQA